MLPTEQDRLTVLDDGSRNVVAAFGISYRHLTPDLQQLFSALSLHPGIDLEPESVGALLLSVLRQAGPSVGRRGKYGLDGAAHGAGSVGDRDTLVVPRSSATGSRALASEGLLWSRAAPYGERGTA